MPALLGRVGLPPPRAVGTNLVVGFFLGVAGFAGPRSSWRWTGPSSPSASPTAVPGAWLGARLTGRMSERALRRWIGVALIAVACAIAVAAAR